MKTPAVALLVLLALGVAARAQEPPPANHPTVTADRGRPLTIYRFAADGLSRVYRLRIDGQDVPVTAFPNIDAAECQRIAADYNAMPPWCHVPARFIGLHYAHLACAGELGVELTAAEPIRSFTIHPARRAVEAKAEGRVLRFRVDRRQPRYFIVEVNELPPFGLIVDPPEEHACSPVGENVVNAGRFLSDATGKVDQTAAFTRAIAAAGGGKTLYVPPGVYLTDTIKIHNVADLGIYLAAGCLVRIKTSPRGENRPAQGIWIDGSRRVRIFGRGYLDQQAYENFAAGGNSYQHLAAGDRRIPAFSQSAVLIVRSQDITVDGLTVRNGRNFNYNIVGCDRVTLRDCKILTPPACALEFTDGIDVVSTDRLTIDGCFACCNDDCFAWGNTCCFAPPLLELAESRELSHCVVRGLVGWNPRANGIRFGSSTMSSPVGIRDLLVENCDFCGMAESALFIGGLAHDPQAPQQPGYGVLKFVDCGFDCARVTRRVFLLRRVKAQRLEFVNLVIDAAGKGGIFEGSADGHVGQLVFRNVRLGGKKLGTLKEADLHLKNVEKVIAE